jgi:hypothetical protein
VIGIHVKGDDINNTCPLLPCVDVRHGYESKFTALHREEVPVQCCNLINITPIGAIRKNAYIFERCDVVKDLAPVISLGFSSDKSNIRKLAEKCKDLLLKSGFSEFLKVGNENTLMDNQQ